MPVMPAPGLRAVSRMDEVHRIRFVRFVGFVGLVVESRGLVRSFAVEWRRGIARVIHRPDQRVAIRLKIPMFPPDVLGACRGIKRGPARVSMVTVGGSAKTQMVTRENQTSASKRPRMYWKRLKIKEEEVFIRPFQARWVDSLGSLLTIQTNNTSIISSKQN